MLNIALFGILCSLAIRIEGYSHAQVEGFVDACCKTVDEAVLSVAGYWQV